MLNPQQLAAIKAYIDSTPALAAQPLNSDGAFAIAAALNLPAVPAWKAWNSAASVDAVQEAVKWASLTPTDSPDGTQAWANRSLACQGKQFNLQMLLTRPGGTLPGHLSRFRDGLQDALSGVPSGVGGAPVDAGWTGGTGVRVQLIRDCTVAEKVLSTGTGTTGSPAQLTFEGTISYQEVEMARAG